MSEGLLAQLDALGAIEGPEWLVRLKRDAIERVRSRGLPTKKHEAWRFTPVRDVVDTAFERLAEPASFAELGWESGPRGAAPEWLRAIPRDGASYVMVDGLPFTWSTPVAHKEARDGEVEPSRAASGVEHNSLARQLRAQPSLIEPVLGRIARTDHFAGMNAALFRDGEVIRVRPGARPAAPLHIVHVSTARERAASSYPRIVVIADEGCEVAITETYLVTGAGTARYLTNAVTEIALGPGARVDHTRIVAGDDRGLHLGHLAVRQERGSFYASRVATLGGALSRLDLDVTLAGEGAEVALDGVYHVDRSEHVDHQVFVDHAAPHTTSSARYRGLLDGKGHAVVNLMGVVRKTAPGTSAHQENRNLLLSDDATIDTKPHLEIETDDVKASHGATIGAVDQTALFYLRSRGVPEAIARDVLTFAFVRELIERIPHSATAARVSDAVLERLPSGARIRELFE